MDNQTPTSIKQLIQGMVPDDIGVVGGIVTRESPLEITLDNDAKMVLTQNILILPEWLTDVDKSVDIMLLGGNINAQTGGEDGAHRHDGGEHEGHLDGDGRHTHGGGEHRHYLSDFSIYGAKMVIHNRLKKGEGVLLLSFNNGKQYYILDRKG